MSHRKERFSSTLKQCLADILRVEMNDPFLKTVFISEVIVSDDLKTARVFVSSSSWAVQGDSAEPPPGFPPGEDELTARLTNAKGFIKRALSQRMYLKYMPELMFIKI